VDRPLPGGRQGLGRGVSFGPAADDDLASLQARIRTGSFRASTLRTYANIIEKELRPRWGERPIPATRSSPAGRSWPRAISLRQRGAGPLTPPARPALRAAHRALTSNRRWLYRRPLRPLLVRNRFPWRCCPRPHRKSAPPQPRDGAVPHGRSQSSHSATPSHWAARRAWLVVWRSSWATRHGRTQALSFQRTATAIPVDLLGRGHGGHGPLPAPRRCPACAKSPVSTGEEQKSGDAKQVTGDSRGAAHCTPLVP
jgi:hypothetical protein